MGVREERVLVGVGDPKTGDGVGGVCLEICK